MSYLIGTISEESGHFVICSKCVKAFDASWYNKDLKYIHTTSDIAREDGDHATLHLLIGATCPYCYYYDNYLGGEENNWAQVHPIRSSDPAKMREEIYQAENEMLRKRLLSADAQVTKLMGEMGRLRKSKMKLSEERDKLADTIHSIKTGKKPPRPKPAQNQPTGEKKALPYR